MNPTSENVNINSFNPGEPASGERLGGKDLLNEYGRSGTVLFYGMISDEEYNTDLIGKTGLAKYDQMRRSDASIRAMLRVVKLPIVSTSWRIDPASDEPIDKEIAQFIEHNLFERVAWSDFLNQSLNFLDFGFSVFEKIYNVDEYNGKPMVMLDNLSSRRQKTIYRWEQSDTLPGITQLTQTGGTYTIPAEKLVIFTLDREGQNYEGISLLRSAYKHWYIKDALYKIEAIKAERQGLGVPIIMPPANASEADKRKAEIQMQNLRANEFSYLELPAGWTFEFADMKASGTHDSMPMIMHQDRQIAKNVLATFLELGGGGHSSGGSHALSADLTRLFEMSEEAIAKIIMQSINQYVIKQLVDLNYTVDTYPKINHAKIADDDIATLATAINQLATAGMINYTGATEQSLRDVMKLPELPDEDQTNENAPQTPNPEGKPKTPAEQQAEAEKVMAVDDIKQYRDLLSKRIAAIEKS